MRYIFLLALIFILSGCGQSYEEIRGFKLGAPISTVKDIDSYEGSLGDSGITIYSKDEMIDWIGKTIGIEVVDGNIGLLAFLERKKNYSYDNFRFDLFKMIEKWGDPVDDKVRENEGNIIRDVVFKPENDTIGKIEFQYMQHGTTSLVSEIYFTKKHLSYYLERDNGQ